ncbi:simple sugar transport system ATP-binding protein [Pseudoduganella flava]|uniref:ATP-binding cassette domain-containing protein n=1 Tax=Pseudoduganella flava TaxID=871742 RepID=A0A562PGG3_9BURK|nr:ABC transporter ATP-binding protein [Pseudoduganella flava]QGZ40319.1 ATP-binding cassette domain-containing protein [Pseudoduganella flava]TWI43509.1 simple sugar transport system ATP-binding protein [Pseudoduganella flava]
MSEPHAPPPGRHNEPRLQLLGISKIYPSVIANADVNLTVMPGEIHAVLGENGAGKSTLMKMIYGVTRPNAGEIMWEGRQVHIPSPAAARRLGIGMVFQHFALFETLTVAENIALALDDKVAPRELAPRIRAVSEQYGLPLDPDRHVHSMSVGERQRVEIVRCLLQHPRLLIMDEPTSVLTPDAVQKLFVSLRQLATEGVSILYISHKLDEIRALCDKATVLRAGRVSGTATPRTQSAHELAELMIGGDLPTCTLAPRAPAEVRLALDKLTVASADPFGTDLRDISLEVRAGEIVGLAGVSGNGQQELMKAISGELPLRDANAIRILGQAAGRLDAAQRRRLGLGFVPEERLGRGAVPAMSLADNALLTGYLAGPAGMLKGGLVRRGAVRAFAERVIERFNVKCGGAKAVASSLSGGNLQKFIVGREIALAPRGMVLAQPTWGVDVGAAMLIRQAIIGLRDQGVAVLVISEELDELFMMCDRIAVLAKGRLSPTIPAHEATIDRIGLWMSGDFSTGGAAATIEEGTHHVPA